MATKVFISWSGDLSKKLGEALRDWLPATLQYVKPYFSPEDIEKGTKWNSEIAKELETSHVGIICLTQDNTEKPWILFEAGALSKSIDKSRVCPLLFNLDNADIKGPLTSFQATRFVKDDFKRLVTMINSTAGDAKLDVNVLEDVFNKWWPDLESKIHDILESHGKDTKKKSRSERDMIEEILELTRIKSSRTDKFSRFNERSLIELMETMNEMMFIISRENGEIAPTVMKHLDRPLKHLCYEAGVPELYEKYRNHYMHMHMDMNMNMKNLRLDLKPEPGNKNNK